MLFARGRGCYLLRDHHKTSIGHLSHFCGLYFVSKVQINERCPRVRQQGRKDCCHYQHCGDSCLRSYIETIEMDDNLNKKHFWFSQGRSFIFGLSLVHPWFVLGLLPEEDRDGTRDEILNILHLYRFLLLFRYFKGHFRLAERALVGAQRAGGRTGQ